MATPKFVLALATVAAALSAIPASAVECRSVGGHIDGERTTSVRQVELKGRTLHLSGRMGGQKMPRRSMNCVPLASGIMCEQGFGPVTVSVMTNGSQMVESITDNESGAETAGFAYQCAKPVGRIR